MTEQERQLIIGIARWMRATGVTYHRMTREYVAPDGAAVTWTTAGSPVTEISVRAAGERYPTWHRFTSVTQAVDLLVALKYLPDQFGTAYRRGYNAGSQNSALAFAGCDIVRAALPAVA